MRILHVIPSLHAGGAERQIALHANALVARGHEITIALLREGPMRSLVGPAVAVEQLASSGNYDPRIMTRILRLLRRLKPDVVQSWLPQMDVLVGAATRVRRVPWLLNERSSRLKYQGGSLQHRVRIAFGKRADAIVSNSEGGLRYWDEVGATRPLRRLIPNIVPTPSLTPAEKGARPLIAYVGRLTDGKNVPVLVDALAAVPEADAIFCGNGPLEASLRAQVAMRGLSNRVTFAGFVQDVPPVLARADVLVLLSDFEGQPNAVLEAMSCGCPVVVSDIPAHRELLDDESAIFVNGRDPHGVAQALEATLRDAAKARARAARARERSAGFQAERVALAYEQLYLELTGRRV
ncbi:MAG TPA: glycosyltransferase [Thermoanaerobaculia bacterium]|nr:glycosyltransferase [Thermoanaerobaculia bacterium]